MSDFIQTMDTSAGLYRVALRDAGGLARDLRAAAVDRRPRLRVSCRGETVVTLDGLVFDVDGARVIVEARSGDTAVRVPHTLVTVDPGPQQITWSRALLAIRATRASGELDPTWASLAGLTWADVPEVAA